MRKALRMAGSLLALASLVSLAVLLMALQSTAGLAAAAVFLPMVLMGLALVWLGNRWPRPSSGRRALRALLSGYRSTTLLYVAAKLGLADLLADGPRTSADLAQSLGAHAPSLHRVIRGLVALGVCSEEDDGSFSLTPLGTWLRAETPGSLRGLALLAAEESTAAWGGLLHSVMTGETAFRHVFGMTQWEHRKERPELNEYFNACLDHATHRVAEAILEAYDFSSFGTIADVGGGHGVLLAAILNAHPSVTGILFEQAHVVDGARSSLEAAGVAPRCRVVGGSFFDRIPNAADAHILKSIIHNWDDEKSLAILRNCHRALKPQGTLLLIERLMPARVKYDPDSVLIDIHMLALTGGRERTEAQFRALLSDAGFTLTRVTATRSPFSIIEGRPAKAGEVTSSQEG